MEHRHLHTHLDRIRLRLIEMGAQVEAMIATATRALVERDEGLVSQAIEQDVDVDRMEVEIDDDCHGVLARNQPTAIDMRFLVAVMKITADLERMADSAVNIAQAARQLNREPPLKPYIDLPRISARVQAMVRESLDAFVSRDAALAASVCAEDDEIDQLYRRIFTELVELMRNDSTSVPRALHLLLVARNFERIADHATNIAEDVVYYVEGRDIRHAAATGVAKAPSTG
ncbi:MAG TPA: phosphate signaling complex protein PhoU [Thermoanaerobaculia bacterium]|nr:phosphate signaling complex protein PhoU [Thermoanaerobaculia bacterium]